MTLYEIDERLANILDFDGDLVDAETGEMVSTEDLEALEIARADKIEGWGLWLKNRAAELEAIKAEAKKLTERAAALSSKIEGSKQRYQLYLAGEKISTPRLSVSYRKSQAVEILDEDSIPTNFMRKKVTFEPDKTAIKDAIKKGEEIPGAALVDRQSMIIR